MTKKHLENITEKTEIRKWLRKMYDCRWHFTNDVITIICDNEEFHIDPATLDEKETDMLIKIMQDESRKTNESLWEF